MEKAGDVNRVIILRAADGSPLRVPKPEHGQAHEDYRVHGSPIRKTRAPSPSERPITPTPASAATGQRLQRRYLAQTVNWGDRVGRATSAAGCVIFLRIRQSRSQNGKFESISLQWRVCYEPDFVSALWTTLSSGNRIRQPLQPRCVQLGLGFANRSGERLVKLCVRARRGGLRVHR
jgi:hypothetical protein